MTIYDSYDNVLLETKVSDKSSLYCGLDNKDRLTLHFALDRHVEIPIGSWCNFEGNRYEVMSDADVKMNHTENYDYTVVLSSYFDLTARYKVRNMVDRRLKFDLVAKPHEHLQMIVYNLNARDGGWSIGSCIDSVEKLVSYNHTNCEEALVNIANTFNTEIDVVGKIISLKKVEYFKDDPLALSYGKGNGFRPGIQRTSVDDGLPVERLFVQGGSKNISLKEYGSSDLHLPKSLIFMFDGNKFDGEDGFDETYAKSFVTDSDGMSVAVEGMAGGREDSLDLSEVYPSRVGNVTGVVFIFKGREYTKPEASWTEDDWNEVQIDIVDNTIPDSLDFNDCLMENGEPLTVIFQSGMLSGREFNATYVADKKKFEIERQDFDGQSMPQGSFIPKIGDSYAVFNVSLPASYISDATTYSGAEYDILREASKYLYEKCVSEFTFAGEIDGMWAKKNWDAIRQRIRIGSYVSFTHESMFPEKPALVRIVGITQYVNNPHYPKIELSNSVGVSTVSSRLSQIENKDAHVAELYEEARRYTKRRYADIKQTIEMLSDAFDNYSEGINPITVETMLAVVGDKSLQYLFTQSLDTDAPSVLEYSFDSNDGVFSVSEAFIKHMTLEIDSISPVHSNDEYLRWNVAAYTSESLEKESGYYLYARVSKDSQQGTFVLSKESIKLEAEAGYYNLLVGILNAELDGERSFASMYGFTEILPGQITTDTIKSADGNTWLDLLKGILHLNNMAGVSGVKSEDKGDQSIAAWFGGLMKDIELDEDKKDAAKSVIRHDGTGYFAEGLFKWDKDTGVNLGNGAIRINYDGSVDFGGNIRIGSTGEETLDSLLTIIAKMSKLWTLDDEGNLVTEKQVVIKNNLIIHGDMASGGEGENTPVEGASEVVIDGMRYPAKDGVIDLTEAFANVEVDLSEYYTKNEVNELIDEVKAGDIDLANYYTKSEVDAKIPKKLSALENDLNLGSFAYKNALAVSDIPDLSGKYLPLTGGTMGANAGIGFRAYNAIDGGGGWAIDALTFYNRNQDKKMGTVSFHGGGNELYYIYIGVNAYNGNNLRIYPGSVRFGDNHILHSGNVGEYNAGSANALTEEVLTDLNNATSCRLFTMTSGYDSTDGNKPTAQWVTGITFRIAANDNYRSQLAVGGNARLYFRRENNGTWNAWKEVAFADSNVASATKLATARTIWGQSFDGTQNVEGDLSIKWSKIYWNADINNYYIGWNSSEYAFDFVNYYGHRFYSKGSERMRITSDGNVGIGTTKPAHKLDVDGTIASRATDTSIRGVYAENSSGGVSLYVAASGNRGLYDATNNKWVMYTNGTNAIFPVGNIGIGTASPQYRLDVDGSGRFTKALVSEGAFIAKGGLEVYGSTPYIDFHYGNSTSDYTSRIIEDASGRLYLNRVLYLVNGERAGVGGINSSYKFNVEGTTCLNGATTINGKVSASGGIDIPNGQQLAFLDASGNRHTIAWDSASNGILIDGNLIVLGELATGLPLQEVPSIPEIGV